MNFTSNINLQKPLVSEKYNIAVSNTNAEIIDSEINELKTKDKNQDSLIVENTKQLSTLSDNLDAEILRAKQSENENLVNINTEKTRATNSENTIASNLSSEISRATEAEGTLESKKANIASPTFTGTPKAPTASASTNTTQIATTAFVQTVNSNHNSSTTAHSDIRELITNLTTKLTALADSDDTTLDQLSEIVAYIKSNRSLIESVTTNKVNVLDIVDSVSSTSTNKPLSAKQGKVLNDLITALTNTVNNKASGSDLTNHISDTEKHITSTERSNLSVATKHANSVHAPSNAEVNQNAFSNVVVGSIIITADSKMDSLTLIGDNVTLTPDENSQGITIGITKDNIVSALGFTPSESSGNVVSYKLTKSGSKIILTGSDGTTSSVDDNDTNTHYESGTVVNNSASATSNTLYDISNGNVYLNHIENGKVKNSHKITGSGATTVTSNSSGAITISSTNTTYDVVSDTANGLCPKTDGTTTKFLRSDGTWAIPNSSSEGGVNTIEYSDAEPSELTLGMTWIGTAT